MEELDPRDKRMEEEVLFDFFVAGVRHHNLHQCIDEIEAGNNLKLVLEPTNKFDPNAVRLEFHSLKQGEDIMTGYVPAKFSASVTASMIVSNLSCEVTEINKTSKPWQQLRVIIREEK